jgi:hypothetical protein
MSKPVEQRSHRMLVERDKCPNGYKSRYARVNSIDFSEAWEMAAEFDKGLPREPSDDLALMKRAMTNLARLLEEMRVEWS